MPAHQQSAAPEVDAIDSVSREVDGLCSSVIEAPETVLDAVDAIVRHAIILQRANDVLHNCTSTLVLPGQCMLQP